jgi:hypothetical protein
MGKSANPWLVGLTMLGLCALGLMDAAFAAPPSPQKGTERLDLHPPRAAPEAAEKPLAAFPSSLHRQSPAAPGQLQLPGQGSEGAHAPKSSCGACTGKACRWPGCGRTSRPWCIWDSIKKASRDFGSFRNSTDRSAARRAAQIHSIPGDCRPQPLSGSGASPRSQARMR